MKKLRVNSNNIQLLSKEIHSKLFPKEQRSKQPQKSLIELSKLHLKHNGLADKETSQSSPIKFQLPPLLGPSIAHHFKKLGEWSERPYLDLIENLFKLGHTPLPMPRHWQFKAGWVKYENGRDPVSVPHPQEDALVFDTEVLYKLSPYPVMATALSSKAWYAWCSPYLTGESSENNHLIPLGTSAAADEKLIVGHNISFDRARVLDEYKLQNTNCFYLDTMSLHVSVSGMCSRQRGAWMKYKKNLSLSSDAETNDDSHVKSLNDYRNSVNSDGLKALLDNQILDQESILNTADNESDVVSNALNEDPWLKHSSLSSLAHVAEHHCNIKLEKSIRDHFASLDPNEIRENFQLLMNYCANDVLATYHVFHKIWPEFKSVVPHPVSFAALKHITKSFLPTTSDWDDYIERCEQMYQDSKLQIESKLHGICNEIAELRLKSDEQPWQKDPWLSQLDWEITPIKYTKSGELFKRQKLPGHPNWFKKIADSDGTLNLTTKTRISSLLLKLSWENNPVIWTDNYGWCFSVPNDSYEEYLKKGYEHIDIDVLLPPEDHLENELDLETNGPSKKQTKRKSTKVSKDENDEKVEDKDISLNSKVTKPKRRSKKSKKKQIVFESDKVVISTLKNILKQRNSLFKIPHENGSGHRVTSLMTKPFQRYFENDILSSSHPIAKEALSLTVQTSYWVSSRERIRGQFVVYKNNKEMSTLSFSDPKLASICPLKPPKEDKIGIIIPQVIPMGTITRRSVEKTWLTASNAKSNRLGSELKSLVRAPPGYCFVGADVDSEELWIASLMGDAVFGVHGGSSLGWMTLEGTKNAGTDLHSKTAKILGISRGEAKVFNYGRIYGAGKKFATTLLKKFNPDISDKEAALTADKLYSATKGKNGIVGGSRVWYGGSESVVFNRLEQIAEQDDPRTPVLGAGITQALQKTNLNANSFLPSRINWAIQSSGVDYLHLLLISMEFLCKYYSIDARLSITVHDELRFLTRWEDRYKCAMALQIANLWTRSMFCYQVGIDDVPQSCAFFSAVDIDWVLRKEVDFECVTPSSPEKLPAGESLDVDSLLQLDEVQKFLKEKHSTDFWDKDDEHVTEEKLEQKTEKLKKPTESLDKDLNSATKKLWVKLQICQTETEFKALKSSFFDEVRLGERKEFSKTVKNEKLDEDIVHGFQLRQTRLPDDIEEVAHIGCDISSAIDEALEENKAEQKKVKAVKGLRESKLPRVGEREEIHFDIDDMLNKQITRGMKVKYSNDVKTKQQQRKMRQPSLDARQIHTGLVGAKSALPTTGEISEIAFSEPDKNIGKSDFYIDTPTVSIKGTYSELTDQDLHETMFFRDI